MSETLWGWIVRAYARPGVAEAALDLQDAHGQNIPLLLFAVWSGGADPARLAEATALVRRWETAVVGPLRAVRRTLKTPVPPIADRGREAVRGQVKAAELAVERLLLEALEPLGRPPGGADAVTALRAAAGVWDRTAPSEAALAKLACALA
jgi:uncharacterized protein (TIGR02444 family)